MDMVKKKARATTPAKAAVSDVADATYDIGRGLLAVGESIKDAAEDIGRHYHVEQIADNLGSLANEVGGLERAVGLIALVAFGTDDDKEKALDRLRSTYLSDY